MEQQILTGNGVRQITSYLGNNGDKQRTTGLGLTQKSYLQYGNNRAQTSMNNMAKVGNYMILHLASTNSYTSFHRYYQNPDQESIIYR